MRASSRARTWPEQRRVHGEAAVDDPVPTVRPKPLCGYKTNPRTQRQHTQHQQGESGLSRSMRFIAAFIADQAATHSRPLAPL